MNQRVSKTSNGKTMILSESNVCGSRKSKSIRKQVASEILCSLGIRTPLSKILVLGDIFF